MKNTLKNTRAVLTKKEKKQFTRLTILDVMISIVDILSLVLLLLIIQFYIQPGTANAISFIPVWVVEKHTVTIISVFFLLFSLKNLAGFLISRAQYKYIAKVAVRISGNNLSSYQQAGFDEFINTDSSVHIRRICFQPFEFCQYVLSGIQQIITQSVLILLTITAIIIFDAELFFLLLLVLLPPVVAVFYFIKKRLAATKLHIRSSNERSFQYVLDALKGYVESNIYNRNDFFLQRFTTHRGQFSKYLFDSLIMQSIPPRIIETFAVLGIFVLLAIAQLTGNTDRDTLLKIGAFMAAAYKIIPGMVKIINTSGQIRAYEFSITDLVQYRKQDHQNLYPADIRSFQLKNISFHYENHLVLDNFCFTISQGDFAGIAGASGKGKTTVLNLLLGFLPPDSGEILVNGESVEQKELKRYWHSIAYVRQQPFFIHDTILRNITLEENDHDEDNLRSALTISGLDTFVAQFPEGLDKIITENGKNISGGQQQRIAIARALYKQADLILLDEPFNELDENSEIALLEHFRELSQKGKLVILITHDQRNLSYCNKIVSLNEQ